VPTPVPCSGPEGLGLLAKGAAARQGRLFGLVSRLFSEWRGSSPHSVSKGVASPQVPALGRDGETRAPGLWRAGVFLGLDSF
jgi:hypothetical protein